MRHALIVGAQWGDEGKGKIASSIAGRFDVCVRFNGGSNAAHTLLHHGRRHKLRMLPVGAFYEKKLLVAQGTVIDAEILAREIETVKGLVGRLDLQIDYRAHVVMPYHRIQDAAHESWRGRARIGSTGSGVGFCFADRNNRMGVRIADLLDERYLQERVEATVALNESMLRDVYGLSVTLNGQEMLDELAPHVAALRPYVGDASAVINSTLGTEAFLFEGSQGALLDNAFGTYPYTVAYSTLSSSLFSSLGVPVFPVRVIGVTSSYATRNGRGPFPTEQQNAAGDLLRNVGCEVDVFGSPRRCGWLDLPALRHAARLSGFSELAVTKLDVLSSFDEVSVCTGYRLNGTAVAACDPSDPVFDRCVPEYRTFEGWTGSVAGARSTVDLPATARRYLEFVEREVNVPVRYVSVGPSPEATIEMP